MPQYWHWVHFLPSPWLRLRPFAWQLLQQGQKQWTRSSSVVQRLRGDVIATLDGQRTGPEVDMCGRRDRKEQHKEKEKDERAHNANNDAPQPLGGEAEQPTTQVTQQHGLQ